MRKCGEPCGLVKAIWPPFFFPKLESSVRALSSEQADIKEQKQQLHSLNVQLREQLESTQEELQDAKSQLNLIHFTATQERQAKER